MQQIGNDQVRYLSPLRCDIEGGRRIRFQFHHGSIKASLARKSLLDFTVFQFHHGSIKAILICTTTLILRRFQFHHGSIKAILIYIFTAYTFPFQFHHGSIKAARSIAVAG